MLKLRVGVAIREIEANRPEKSLRVLHSVLNQVQGKRNWGDVRVKDLPHNLVPLRRLGTASFARSPQHSPSNTLHIDRYRLRESQHPRLFYKDVEISPHEVSSVPHRQGMAFLS